MRKPSTPPLTVDEFEQLRRLLNEHAGLWFGPDARPAVERRLRDRMLANGLVTFAEYISRLGEGHAADIEDAVEVCTINETYVFRQEGQLRAFQSRVLPRLAGRDRLTVWSAGCATGEEVYTIGSLVLDSGLFAPDRVRIFGTDISRRCIAQARRGVYSASSFRSARDGIYDAYFPRSIDDDGTRVVCDRLRSICHFRQGNLVRENDASTLGNVDVIFCRNVLIHFDDATRRKVVRSFYDRLTPGGFLLLGHSESLLNVETPFQAIELEEDIVYRKPSIDDLVEGRIRGSRR